MVERNGDVIIGDSWDEMGVEIPQGKYYATTNIKIKNCPVCKELGKRNDYSLSVLPSEGTGKCHKCGTKYIIRKEEKFERVEKTFTPPSRRNLTKLSEEGLQFFVNRRISQEAVNHFKIVEKDGAVAFPYFYNGELVNIKYRGINEKKFFQSPNGKHVLFNYDEAKKHNAVIVTEGECFDGSTEILTPNGWKRLDQFDHENDLVAQWDNERITFVKPLAYIKKHYDGEMVKFALKGFSLKATAKHNLVVYNSKKDGFNKVTFDSVESQRSVPRVGIYQGGKGLPLSDHEIRLAVALSADFTFRKSGLLYGSFKKDRKKIRFEELCSLASQPYNVVKPCKPDYKSYTIHSVDAPWYARKIFDHSWIGQMTRHQMNVFLEEILFWDGNSVPNRNQIEYSSKEISNATFVQTLAHLSGFCSTIIRRSNPYGEWFKVSILFGKKLSTVESKYKTTEQVSQEVYCVNVPSGAIMVRQDEYISVVGNCDAMSLHTAGFPYAVSVDSGAPNPNDQIDKKLECFTNCIDLFENADIIYIATDNDDNGRRLAEEIKRRVDTEKVRMVDFGKYKDANEALMYEGPEFLQDAIKNAREIKFEGIITLDAEVEQRMLDMYDNGLPKGSTTYYPSIDKRWKWREGEVTVGTGYNNEGKSTLLVVNLPLLKCMYEGWKVGAFVPENMPEEEFYEELVHCLLGKTTDIAYPQYRATREEYIAAMNFVREHYILIYPEKNQTLEELFVRFDYLVRKHGIRIAIFDPYNQIEHNYNRGETIDLYVSRFMSLLKKFTVKRKLCTILVAHQNPPKTRAANGKDLPRPDLYTIKNGGTIPDKADNVIYAYRPHRFSAEEDPLVEFGSEKLKKKKLLMASCGPADLLYDWRSHRYLDPALGNRSPFENFKLFAKKETGTITDELPF